MRRSTLIFSLALCALVAVTPLLVWAVAAMADRIDDVGLGMLAVSVPVGIGLGAVLLAVHGLLVNQELAVALEEEYEAIASSLIVRDGDLVTVGTTVAPVPASTVAASTGTAPAATMATVELETQTSDGEARKPRKVGKAGKAVGDVASRTGGRLIGRQIRRTKSKARWAIQKELGNTFRGMGPKL